MPGPTANATAIQVGPINFYDVYAGITIVPAAANIPNLTPFMMGSTGVQTVMDSGAPAVNGNHKTISVPGPIPGGTISRVIAGPNGTLGTFHHPPIGSRGWRRAHHWSRTSQSYQWPSGIYWHSWCYAGLSVKQ